MVLREIFYVISPQQEHLRTWLKPIWEATVQCCNFHFLTIFGNWSCDHHLNISLDGPWQVESFLFCISSHQTRWDCLFGHIHRTLSRPWKQCLTSFPNVFLICWLFPHEKQISFGYRPGPRTQYPNNIINNENYFYFFLNFCSFSGYFWINCHIWKSTTNQM